MVNVYAEPSESDDEDDGEEGTTEYQILDTTEYPDEPERQPDLVSEAAVVMDAKTGAILYDKNSEQKEYPASITKIMTCLLAVEKGNLEDMVNISHEAVFGIERDSSHVGLMEGEQVKLEHLLYALMIESANDAAIAIAEHIGGSVEGFAEMMNAKAEELGCTNTHFVNPNGLFNEEHYTCPKDMALITKEALKYPMFRELTQAKHSQIPPTNLCEETRELWKAFKLTSPKSTFYYEYALGGKTGYVKQSKSTLMTYANKDGMELICVVMMCAGRKISWKDTRAAFRYAYNNYKYVYPLRGYTFSEGEEEDTILKNFYNSQSEDKLPISYDEDSCVLVKNDIDESAIEVKFMKSASEAPGVLGRFEFVYNGETLGSTPITYDYHGPMNVYDNDGEVMTVEDPKAEDRKEEVEKTNISVLKIMAIVGIALFVAFMIFYINILIKRHKKRSNRYSPKSKKKKSKDDLHF
ncbi:MAG: D-alanyl-D-alanine carboxypeptidase [Lachnospiraceae bacterium]|nr:D-alanyl-D-alanine carboxypeptidase [Lachnospiraceae bacterium]